MHSKIWLALAPFLVYVQVAAAGIITEGPLTRADFWVQHNPDGEKLILDAAGIKAYNEQVLQSGQHLAVVDLATFPQLLDGAAVKKTLTNYNYLRVPLYAHGKLFTAADQAKLKALTDPGTIPPVVVTRYGVAVQHSSLRNLPREEGLYEEADDHYYDDLQETVVEPGEPVAILHASKDHQYFYVQMYNVRGWLLQKDVALTTREHWLTYVQPDKFIQVVDKDYQVPGPAGKVFYLMGARMRLEKKDNKHYTVLLPYRNQFGRLEEQAVNLPKTAALHEGYLPYTANNVVRQAFKFYGNPYGWGGSFRSVDCSSLVGSVYKTMGVILPRNSDQLRRCPLGGRLDLAGASHEQRQLLYQDLRPGATIHMPGHVMLYLGQVDQKPYVIHAASSYYEPGAATGAHATQFKLHGQPWHKVYVRKVLVSDLALHGRDGKIFADRATSVRDYDLQDFPAAAAQNKLAVSSAGVVQAAAQLPTKK
ncbi:MAG: SH3 domain-containing protein [Acidaminococcaceae bacterium]|nr:SH3 domain-containing protein [Acidaminococcaceae bacterium]